MPPKGKDTKKGAVVGNFKSGKALKDILPPNSKPPREGQIVKQEGEPNVSRNFEYEPQPHFPEWPGNEEAKQHDFSCKKDAEDQDIKFEDNCQIFLPPSFKEFMRGEDIWLRPDSYIREIIHETEMDKLKAEKRKQSKTRKAVRKAEMMSLTGAAAPTITNDQQNLLDKDIHLHVNRDEIPVSACVIASLQRLETEEEIKKRKEDEEKKAAAEKGAKKKAPPAKGAPVHDPSDDPQVLQIPIENSLDLGFSMPAYTKWATSQFQLAKDRAIRDVTTGEKIWERIYPQQNGAPVISPSGKYWVKVRFMGKERLVEIDDRIPCDTRSKPLFARTSNPQEIWPQLLMKALLKVYSYKWFTESSQYEKEIGDGSIIYSLTGLIPEYIPMKDFEKDGMEHFRQLLSDECYFGHKAYLTVFCGEEFRPRLPSQLTALKKMEIQKPTDEYIDEYTEYTMSPGYDSSSKMLNKLKQSASMAITVTTGRKLKINKNPNASNVIPGFGYALMDIFENEFVDMDSIVKVKDQIEETKSPFQSPAKRGGSPSRPRDSSITKEEYRRQRKEERARILDDIERREREPPKQFSLINIKTAVTRYPTINYISPFSNDEIYEGKRCLMNHWRRNQQAETLRQQLIERTASPKKTKNGTSSKFNLSLHQTGMGAQAQQEAAESQPSGVDFSQKEELKPRPRALGGVWISSSDFPSAFQHLIIYHNLSSFKKTEVHHDIWQDQTSPFISNEKDVYVKLSVDDELFNQYKAENKIDPAATLAEAMAPPTEQQLAKESWEDDKKDGLLPGEKRKAKPNPNQIFVAFAPTPTSKPYDILPRYFNRMQLENCEDDKSQVDFTLTKYFEAVNYQFAPGQCTQNTIWLKPLINAPLGFSLFMGSNLRNIEIVSRQDYLTAQHHMHHKQYTADFLPQTAGRMNVFAKYEFKINEAETRLNIRVGCNSDKYLANYMRLKIVDKNSSLNQANDHLTFNNMNVQNLCLPKNELGYLLVVEGNMPYNTLEGQIQIDVQSTADNFALDEVVSTEPIEWTDTYKPWKYGIIFKEKVVFHQADNIMASINLRLLKNGKDFPEEVRRAFRFEVLDNNKVIYSKKGWNQLNLTHFLFRSNQGLPETADSPDAEIKHNYVLQAIFDLHQWPDAKCANEDTDNISWVLKFFTSETIALIKDTDKEDREKALKVSWETAEPGRAEKAAKSRQRYLIQQKQKAGESLTDDDLIVLYEKRERVRKKDLEEQANSKGKKAPAPAKADPKKGAKGGDEKPKVPVPMPEEEPALVLPEPSQHVNANIVEFLNHFKAERLIQIDAKSSATRKREDEEKQAMADEKAKQKEIERQFYEQVLSEREHDKESREKFKKESMVSVMSDRTAYKEKLSESIDQRNKYRDRIIARNEKMRALTDILSQDKIDLNALQAAVDAAIENTVKKEIIERGQKQLTWLRYCKEVEGLLSAAVQEKVKENLLAILERIEKEGIVIEAKALSDAKNVLSKLK